MNKIIVFIVSIFIISTCPPAFNWEGNIALAEQDDFVIHKDPHGFSIAHPQNWHVKLLSSGAILVGEDLESAVGPTVAIWTITLKKPATSKEMARSMAELISAINPTFNVISMNELKTNTKDTVLKARYTELLTNVPYRMFLLCSVDGNHGMASGFYAPENRYAAEKQALVKILNSFKIDPQLRDPKKIAPPMKDFVTYRDPNEGAFTVLVPNGWQVRGGMIRPYIDAAVALEIKKDPSGTVAIYSEQPAVPIFSLPNQTMAFAGFTEGAHYNPSGGIAQDMIIWRYLPGPNYLQYYFIPRAKQTYPDLEIIDIKNRPDITRFFPKGPMISDISSGEADIKFSVAGTPVKGRIFAITNLVSASGTDSGIWYANYLAYNAPPDEFEQLEAIVSVVKDSFTIDPNWKMREAQEQVKRSQILSQSANEIADIISSSYESRSKAMDEVSRKWSNAMLGVVDLVDSQTGEIHYGVPSGSNHYWTNGSKMLGTVAGTDTADSPGFGFREMHNLDDLAKD